MQELSVVETQASEDTSIRELFCFEGYDRARNVGFFLHLTRWYLDPSIWREQVQIYLPDGQYLLRRNWERADPTRGAGGALLKAVCEEDGRRWRIRYSGPARPCTAEELSNGPLPERPQVLAELDVVFESDFPAWQLGERGGDHRLTRWHEEQPGRIKGRLQAGSAVTEIDGVGYRDHSRGPRKMEALFDHCWVHGVFPSGRAFSVFHIRSRAGDRTVESFSQAAIWHEGRIHKATCSTPPLLGDTSHSLTAPPRHFSIDLVGELAPMHITAEVQRSVPHSTTADGEWLDGVTNKSLAQLVAYEQPTLFRWNGETGVGHVEQSRRLDNV
jgi:hypothetical protein